MPDVAGTLFDDLEATPQSGSNRLTTADLVGIAKTSSRDHLVAISERAQIEPAVTDVLLGRDNSAVVHSVAGNSGQQTLKTDFAKLSKPNAQRPLRFWQVREVSATSA